MGRCEYCTKSHITLKGVSFHRFPENEEIKLKWIRNMGRSNWIPTKCGVLCSLHFEKNCIDFRDSRARLRKGSVPTIFDYNKGNKCSISNTDHSQSLDKHTYIKEEKVDIHECDIQRLKCRPLADQSINIYHQETKINLHGVNHDHVYDDPPDTVKQKLGVARIKIKKLTHENHVLRQKAERARKTLNSMKDLVSQLRDFKQLCNNEQNSKDSRQMIHLVEQLICRFTNSRSS